MENSELIHGFFFRIPINIFFVKFYFCRYREQRVRGHRSQKKGKGRSEEAGEGGEGKGSRGPRGRSQSLDAILEELYLSDNEGDGPGSLIPRAKLAVTRYALTMQNIYQLHFFFG